MSTTSPRSSFEAAVSAPCCSWATASGETGTAQITATADADLGEGVRELITLLDVNVVAGEAVAGTISVVGSAQPPIEPRR